MQQEIQLKLKKLETLESQPKNKTRKSQNKSSFWNQSNRPPIFHNLNVQIMKKYKMKNLSKTPPHQDKLQIIRKNKLKTKVGKSLQLEQIEQMEIRDFIQLQNRLVSLKNRSWIINVKYYSIKKSNQFKSVIKDL